MNTFDGFNPPEENWSKLPHQFIEALPVFSSLAELKVVVYVLRHTWGYHEYDEGKRISIDEFKNGRHKRNGGRIDSGVGMAENSIRDGIDRAVEHGFLLVERDESDAARIRVFYSLAVSGDSIPGSEVEPLKLNPPPAKVEPRTKKETIERKENNSASFVGDDTRIIPEGEERAPREKSALEKYILSRFPGVSMPKGAIDKISQGFTDVNGILLEATERVQIQKFPPPSVMFDQSGDYRDWAVKVVDYVITRSSEQPKGKMKNIANQLCRLSTPIHGYFAFKNNRKSELTRRAVEAKKREEFEPLPWSAAVVNEFPEWEDENDET